MPRPSRWLSFSRFPNGWKGSALIAPLLFGAEWQPWIYKSLPVLGRRPSDGNPGEILGVISISYTLRPDAVDALRALHGVPLERDRHAQR